MNESQEITLHGTVAGVAIVEGYMEAAVWVNVNHPEGDVGKLYGYAAAELAKLEGDIAGAKVTIIQKGSNEWISAILPDTGE